MTYSNYFPEQEKLFEVIQNNKELYNQFRAICYIDFLSEFMPLYSIAPTYWNFSMNGIIFAEDGCAGYYVLLDDKSIGYISLDSIVDCGRVAENLQNLLELELNCAYSWHNYGWKKYADSPELLKKEVIQLELEGREEFLDAYGDDMPPYDILQKKISKCLHIKLSTDITLDILPLFYKAATREPKFFWESTEEHSADLIYP